MAIYAGNVKSMKDKFGNDCMVIKMTDADIVKIQQQATANRTRGVVGVQMFLSKRKEVGKFGDTHYLTLNEKQKPQTYGKGGNQDGGAGGTRPSNPPPSQNEHRYSQNDLPDDAGFPN